MRLLKTLFFLLTLIIVLSCSKDENDVKIPGIAENKNKNLTSIYPEASRLEFPRLKGGSSLVLIHKTNDKYGVNFSTEWDCTKKSQRWSCYQMHAGNTGGNTGRYQEGYPYDELLDFANYFTTGDGTPFDPFWNSGYDHGHICPSADRQYSKEANRQTFFLTNIGTAGQKLEPRQFPRYALCLQRRYHRPRRSDTRLCAEPDDHSQIFLYSPALQECLRLQGSRILDRAQGQGHRLSQGYPRQLPTESLRGQHPRTGSADRHRFLL